jgi:hypothetical protein
LLSVEDLKVWLHQDKLTKTDKLLIILTSFDQPASIPLIRARASEAGVNASSWNVQTFLKSTSGKAIQVPGGWELSRKGHGHLASLGVLKKPPNIDKIATDFRAEALKISNSKTRAFVEEAIACFEYDLFRSAIVMSWLSAIDVLHAFVVANHLRDFNIQATKDSANRRNQWKIATTTDDLGSMKESDFVETLYKISIIGKNVRDELQLCLKRRNGCGHPNSLKLRGNTVAAHLEILILNVFVKFA